MNEITVHEAHERLNGNTQFLDVRERDEVVSGMIPGATHIALGQLATRWTELDPSRPVVAVCRSGKRSEQATIALRDAGLDVVNMQGGMEAWREAGFPTA